MVSLAIGTHQSYDCVGLEGNTSGHTTCPGVHDAAGLTMCPMVSVHLRHDHCQ